MAHVCVRVRTPLSQYSAMWAVCIMGVLVCLFRRAPSFVGSVCRIETIHQLLSFKRKFPNHFAFTIGRYLFLLLLIQFI